MDGTDKERSSPPTLEDLPHIITGKRTSSAVADSSDDFKTSPNAGDGDAVTDIGDRLARVALVGGRGGVNPGTGGGPQGGREGSFPIATPTPAEIHRDAGLNPPQIMNIIGRLATRLFPPHNLLPPLRDRWTEGTQIVGLEIELKDAVLRYAETYRQILARGGVEAALALDPILRRTLYERWFKMPVHDLDGNAHPASVLSAEAIEALDIPSPYNARNQRNARQHNIEARARGELGGLAPRMFDDSVEWRIAKTSAHNAYLDGRNAHDPPTLPINWYHDFLATVAYNSWQRVVSHGYARFYGLVAYHFRTRRGVTPQSLVEGALRTTSYVSRYTDRVPTALQQLLVRTVSAMLEVEADTSTQEPALNLLDPDMLALANALGAIGIHNLHGALIKLWTAHRRSHIPQGRDVGVLIQPIHSHHHYAEGAFPALSYGPTEPELAALFQHNSIEVFRVATFVDTPLPGDLAAYHERGATYHSDISIRVMGEGIAMENDSSPVLFVDPPSSMNYDRMPERAGPGGAGAPKRYNEAWSFAPWGGLVYMYLYNVRIQEGGSRFWTAIWRAVGALPTPEAGGRSRVANNAKAGSTVVFSPSGPTSTDAILSRMRRTINARHRPAGAPYGVFAALLDPVDNTAHNRSLSSPEGLFYPVRGV